MVCTTILFKSHCDYMYSGQLDNIRCLWKSLSSCPLLRPLEGREKPQAMLTQVRVYIEKIDWFPFPTLFIFWIIYISCNMIYFFEKKYQNAFKLNIFDFIHSIWVDSDTASVWLDHNFSRKGMRSLFLNLIAEPIRPSYRHGNVKWAWDAHPSSGKSCLFCISRWGPGIPSRREWVLVLAKSAAVLAVSMSDGRDLENQAEGYGGVASACTHIRSRSPRWIASGR